MLSSISSGLEFWSVNYTSSYESSKTKVFKIIKFVDEISSNQPNDLLAANVYQTLDNCCLAILQWANTISVISKQGTFSPFSSLVILLLVLPSNFIVSGIKVQDNILSLFWM